jgi:hypothetical protein
MNVTVITFNSDYRMRIRQFEISLKFPYSSECIADYSIISI